MKGFKSFADNTVLEFETGVTAVVDPADYGRVLQGLETGDDDLDLRRLLAGKVFAHTASYDAAIAAWFAARRDDIFPDRLTLPYERAHVLRYGENRRMSDSADPTNVSGSITHRDAHG